MPVADDEPLRDFPDRALRQLLGYPQHLRSLLRCVVPELADGFDCDRARSLEREFPLDDWRRRESDLLFLIPYQTAGEELWALVCVLIEHQKRHRSAHAAAHAAVRRPLLGKGMEEVARAAGPTAGLASYTRLADCLPHRSKDVGQQLHVERPPGRTVRFSRLCARLAAVVLEPGVAGAPALLDMPMSGYKRWPWCCRKSIA